MKEQTQNQLKEALLGIIVVVALILFIIVLREHKPDTAAAQLPTPEQTEDSHPFVLFGQLLSDDSYTALDSTLSLLPDSLLSLSEELHSLLLTADSLRQMAPDSVLTLAGEATLLGRSGRAELLFNDHRCDTIRFTCMQMTAHGYWEVLDAVQEQCSTPLVAATDSIRQMNCYQASDSLGTLCAYYLNDGELGVPVVEYLR